MGSIQRPSGFVWKSMFSLLLLLVCTLGHAQEKKLKDEVREGNDLYADEKYDEAFKKYSMANLLDSSYAKATFNMGDALYRMDKPAEAKAMFKDAEAYFESDEDKAKTFHNIGNCDLKQAKSAMESVGQTETPGEDPSKLLNSSIENFKKALRLDPADEDSRYNLGYAKRLLSQIPEEEQQKKDEDQKQDQQKDEGENKDQKPDDKGKDQEDQQKGDKGDQEKEKPQDQEKGDQEKGDQEKGDQGEEQEKQDGENGEDGKPQEQQPQSQQDAQRAQAERQLDQLNQQEKELQDKLSKQRMQGRPIKVEKDW